MHLGSIKAASAGVTKIIAQWALRVVLKEGHVLKVCMQRATWLCKATMSSAVSHVLCCITCAAAAHSTGAVEHGNVSTHVLLLLHCLVHQQVRKLQ